MRPDEQEDGDLPSALGKIDIDVAEIRLESLTWIPGERDEGFDMAASVLADITAHGIIASLVVMLVAQPLEDAIKVCRCLGGACSSSLRICWMMG